MSRTIDFDFIDASFRATIAFAILAILGLFVSGWVLGDPVTLVLGLFVAGFSYASQSLFTVAPNFEEPNYTRVVLGGLILQLVACLLWLWAVFHILGHA